MSSYYEVLRYSRGGYRNMGRSQQNVLEFPVNKCPFVANEFYYYRVPSRVV